MILPVNQYIAHWIKDIVDLPIPECPANNNTFTLGSYRNPVIPITPYEDKND